MSRAVVARRSATGLTKTDRAYRTSVGTLRSRLKQFRAVLAAGLGAGCVAGCAAGSPMDLLDGQAALVPTGSLDEAGKQAPKTRTGRRGSALAVLRSIQATKGKVAAFAASDELVKKFPNDRPLAEHRALLALEIGRPKTAETYLRQLAKSENAHWRVHSALGAALSAQGQHKAAVAALERGLKNSPDNPVLLNNLAMAHALAGRTKEAERTLAKAEATAKTRGEQRRIRHNRALIAGLSGRYSSYRKIAATALPRDDVDRNVAILRGLKPRVIAPGTPDEAGGQPARGSKATAEKSRPPEPEPLQASTGKPIDTKDLKPVTPNAPKPTPSEGTPEIKVSDASMAGASAKASTAKPDGIR